MLDPKLLRNESRHCRQRTGPVVLYSTKRKPVLETQRKSLQVRPSAAERAYAFRKPSAGPKAAGEEIAPLKRSRAWETG